jgi:hypothetical protein
MTPLAFGVSQDTLWPNSFESDLALYREAVCEEVCA